MAEPLERCEDHRRAEQGGETVERVDEAGVGFTEFERPLRGVVGVDGDGEGDTRVVEIDAGTSSTLLNHLERSVERDAVEPGEESAASLELPDVLEGTKKAVLGDVVGVLGAAREVQGEGEETWTITPYQLAEGAWVAAARSEYESVGGVGHRAGCVGRGQWRCTSTQALEGFGGDRRRLRGPGDRFDDIPRKFHDRDALERFRRHGRWTAPGERGHERFDRGKGLPLGIGTPKGAWATRGDARASRQTAHGRQIHRGDSARPRVWQRFMVVLKALASLTDHAKRNVMIHWKWAEMGKHGGMVISKAPAMLTVYWERNGNGCTAQWWVGNQCVRTVTPARA
jgi:hypothetical protein